MFRNTDGEIVLNSEDERRLNVTLASLDRHVRYSQIYTVEEVTEFIRDWIAEQPHV